MDPKVVLSSHLPPVSSAAQIFLSSLASVPDAQPFVGPNQAALEMMLTGMTQGKEPVAVG